MEDSSIPLEKWTLAVWLVANTKAGITSVGLAEALGITQKSAWFMLHRIRAALENGTPSSLSGPVEVDEVYLGGKEKNKHRNRQARFSKCAPRKMIVIGVIGVSHGKPQVRLKVVDRPDSATLQKFVRDNVSPGETVFTDEAAAYKGLAGDYNHRSVDHSKTYVDDGVTTNHLEAFWTQLKAMWRSYVSFDVRHASQYLDERAFRFNHRWETPGRRFYLIARRMFGKRLMYEDLVRPPN